MAQTAAQIQAEDPRNVEPLATIRDALHGHYHPGCADCTARAQEVLDLLAERGWQVTR